MEALAPGAAGDAFEPYQSTSPNGAWILDVRKEEDGGTSFAAIRVLSAETGEKLYDCPDRWRLWDLHGIDWLCDGTIPSIPPTRAWPATAQTRGRMAAHGRASGPRHVPRARL